MNLLINPRGMSFEFTVPNMLPSTGVQKVAGFSRGYHHWNSVRLGIRKENNYCVLYAYIYRNGKRIIERLCKVLRTQAIKCTLQWSKNIFVSVEYDSKYYCAQLTSPLLSNPIGYKLGSYAEQDHTQKRLDFNVELNNVKYW